MAQVKRCGDYIIFMGDGEVIEVGKIEAFFNRPKQALSKEYIQYMGS